jgi:CDP-glucose 4,6-dehydratase
MHFLITGHTGFKGAWLSLMLQIQGHEVSGISLDPFSDSLFNKANLSEIFLNDLRIDICDANNLRSAVTKLNPEIVIHLAAQPLVQASYTDPISTFQTNVIGTLNILEATRNLTDLKATLIVTTDKVYKNFGHLRGYTELDELGGDDPYSASKAAADIAAQSWIKNYANSPIAIARAGNVIGGGDSAINRLVPDLVSAYSNGEIPKLRNPDSVRPWQHVLDCLNGYLLLIDKMVETKIGGEWNFGPSLSEKFSVCDLVNAFANSWFDTNPDRAWEKAGSDKFPESSYLLLDSSKARRELNWTEQLDFFESVAWTVDWYKFQGEVDARHRTADQIRMYLKRLKGAK